MANELTGLEVEQVDLVGRAANRRRWLLLKADGLPEEIVEELLKDESLDGELRAIREAFDTQFPQRSGAQPSQETSLYVDETFDDHIIVNGRGEDRWSVAYTKDVEGKATFAPREQWQEVERKVEYIPKEDAGESGGGGDAAHDTNETTEGGEADMSKEELAKAQEELDALRKAATEKDGLLTAAEAGRAEALQKAAQAEALVKAQRREARSKELEPMCKSAQIEVGKVLDLEESAPETAKWLIEKVGLLVKQVDELAAREEGTAKSGNGQATFAERVEAIAKEKGITAKEAGYIVAKADPELAKQHVAGKEYEGR